MCASGSYTRVVHSREKTRNAENFIRSAKAPVMSAGVITANIAWKIMNAWCGMVAAYPGYGSVPTPRRPAQASDPTNALPGANARL